MGEYCFSTYQDCLESMSLTIQQLLDHLIYVLLYIKNHTYYHLRNCLWNYTVSVITQYYKIFSCFFELG